MGLLVDRKRVLKDGLQRHESHQGLPQRSAGYGRVFLLQYHANYPRCKRLVSTVGMPVTRHPPCSPGRAVFPHPVPRLYSHPRCKCWLCPAGRLASGGPVQQCPAEVSCAGCVLPSRPSPCSGLSPPLSTTRDKTPQAHAADCFRLPVGPYRSCWVSQVLRRLSSCMPWPEDSGGPTPPRPCGGARVAFGSVKTLGVRN